MTATAKAPTNGHRRPVVIEVDRSRIVGEVMDWQVLAQEAMYANGAALQILVRVDADPAIYEAIRATHDTHARLSRLVDGLRQAAGVLDGRPGS